MSWTITGVNKDGQTFQWTIHSKAIVDALQGWLDKPLNRGTPGAFPETDKHFKDPETGESIHVHRNWTLHIEPNQ